MTSRLFASAVIALLVAASLLGAAVGLLIAMTSQ
jgi:hypothetical protein